MGADDATVTQQGGPSPAYAGSELQHDDLARRLAGLARDLHQQPEPQGVLDRVVAAAVAMVPGAEEGTITLVHSRRRVQTAAATGERARALDRAQDETGQGPCLDAVFERETVRVDDLAGEERWPELAARAEQIGARSVLCFQLFVHRGTLGSLDLIAGQPGAFSDESEDVGVPFASHAAVAVASASELGQVRSALATRDLIGQAKGILMERYKLTADEAFSLLTQASQATNRKLHDVARDLTTSGTLDRPA